MPLSKEVATFSFGQGIDTKTDPKQLPFGKLLICENAVFSQSKSLIKRNGYQWITSLPDTSFTYLNTFHDDLLAIGTTLQSYSSASTSWQNHGELIPIQMSVLSAVRTNTTQKQADCIQAPNGLTCIAYTDQNTANLSANIYKYCVIDSATGNYVVSPVQLSADPTYGTPKVYILGYYFIIIYTAFTGGTYHLRFIAIPYYNTSLAIGPVDISTSYTPSATVAWEAALFGNQLYVAYNAVTAPGIKMTFISPNLTVTGTVTLTNAHAGTLVSVAAENVPLSLNLIWVTYYDSATKNAYTIAVDPLLHVILSETQVITNEDVANISSTASLSVLTFYYEINNNYSFDNALPTHFIKKNTCNTSTVVGSPTVMARSVGLASKPFFIGNPFVGTKTYMLVAYQSPFQSTYFLMDSNGNVVSKFAYQNGGGYLTTGLPNAVVNSNVISICYLYKFSINSVNKTQSAGTGQQNTGIYAQQGVNIVTFDFTSATTVTAEIGSNLNISGAMMWAYDGFTLSEQNFHFWPDLDLNVDTNKTSKCIAVTPNTGAMTAQDYFYIGTYEWQDNQGNIHRSGISIQIPLKTASLTGAVNTVIVNFPTLRLTYKITNPVKLVLYRASAGQPTFYQVTSISQPILNSTTVDYLPITDAFADTDIVGNSILYTTGGVVENTGGLASNGMTLFDNRLWSIRAEDPNTLDFSQLIIPQTPVEMSLNLTKYISPTVGSETSTGPMKCLAVMDDKLIIFKSNSINYFSGQGPDATGAQNNYSEPIFITSTVTCDNNDSIIITPMGLLFEATYNEGIWLLGRDLTTKYIGADVQAYNQFRVVSADSIPGTTYVLFTLSNNVTLMYDYFYNQWGTFKGVRAISGCVYQGLHTWIDSQGRVFQETPGQYRDGSAPVLMKVQTGWLNLMGIQGLQRAYWMFLNGTYASSHQLSMTIGYDYNSVSAQAFNIVPTNSTNTYGSESPYGNSAYYGGVSTLEQWRINLKQQKCQALQFTLQETFKGTGSVGPGLVLSATTLVFGKQKGWPRLPAANSIG